MHCPWVHSYGDMTLEGACGGKLGPGPCALPQGLSGWGIHTNNLGDLYINADSDSQILEWEWDSEFLKG